MLVLAIISAMMQAVPQSSAASTSIGRSLPAGDSVRILRSVRSAQSSFELFRRSRLPLGRLSGGTCDIRIGRYCYWRGDDDDDKPPPPEPPEVVARRDALIRALDSATHTLAGDEWIAGQHVRYLVEAGRIDDAVRFATTECGATRPWCDALAGYAAQRGGRFATADSAYAASLSAMEPAERCRWLDTSILLDGDLDHRFDRLDCAGREVLVRRLFWFGAPLYSVGATDLLTEHLARVTRARVAEHAATIDGEAWADDERELMIRYGWPRWYSRSLPQFGSQRAPSITGHDAGMPYNYLPSIRTLDHVGQTTPDDWHLDESRALTGYAPEYARSMHDVPNQVAQFRRGDSTLVVAAWDVRRDTTLIGRNLDAALVLAREGQAAVIARQTDAKAVGRIAVTGIIDSGLVSLELLAKEDRRAARARLGIAPRSSGRLALSDLLLYTADVDAPDNLDAVRDSALASAIVSGARAIGVFWEAYGLPPRGEPVHFTLTVEEVDVGVMRRVAERLKFTDPTSSLRIQWDEVPRQHDGIAGRGVRVDLSRLRNGHYRMQLAIAADDGATVVASRDIEVR